MTPDPSRILCFVCLRPAQIISTAPARILAVDPFRISSSVLGRFIGPMRRCGWHQPVTQDPSQILFCMCLMPAQIVSAVPARVLVFLSRSISLVYLMPARCLKYAPALLIGVFSSVRALIFVPVPSRMLAFVWRRHKVSRAALVSVVASDPSRVLVSLKYIYIYIYCL